MSKLRGWTAGIFVLLILNSAYLAAGSWATVLYMANVLLHVVLGLLAAAGFGWLLWRRPAIRRGLRWPATLLLLSAGLGILLIFAGNTRSNAWALWTHIGLALAGVVWLVLTRTRRTLIRSGLAVVIVLPMAWRLTHGPAGPEDVIRNQTEAPLSMEEEGAGPGSPFWPSAAKTTTGGTIPADFFLSSEKCGECHPDIYEQWRASAHHFASFNNQFYRRSIEHMQEVKGETRSSRWCAGCHDHAVLFSGKWDTPIIEQIDTPEAQAGLGCVSCHAIVHVDGTVGNGAFTLDYPGIHALAASENAAINALAGFLTNAEPAPHRETFMKPFMRTSEFCSACHKVHLDAPVNDYRWLRGFNSYDNWQASGVSGEGARSFYYPAQPMNCAGCHMPLVPGKDPAARGGLVRSHRFPGANTALAHVNQDEKQMKVTRSFLESGFVTVDIFAAAPAGEGSGLPMARRAGEGQALMSTFAVGEEAEQARQVVIREVGLTAAPLDVAQPLLRAGETVRVDVVARTRGIGHFFPGGTVDAFDVWLDVEARDATGRLIFTSGAVAGGGAGPVDPGAHFYRSLMLDGAGEAINKRNAWQTRSLLYVRLIPPGAADVAHYRIAIPNDAAGPVTLTARLNHRKFAHYYTQWSYAGRAAGGQDPALVSTHHDSRDYSFDPADIPANVSGKVKGEIPVLPIVTLAEARAELRLGNAGTAAAWRPVVRRQDWERWNDWGIGLLLQGDLKGAEYAFLRAAEADPANPDGWLNVARALVEEGETERAKPFLGRALEISPGLARVHFFQAMVEKADGDYEAALASLREVLRQYPRDRVALNQMGRIQFLMRDYLGAVASLKKVLAVDPEDVQAHYSLMLANRGAGEAAASAREQKLFIRFKADESAQRLTAQRRRISPEDNNERQPIHDHVSAPIE